MAITSQAPWSKRRLSREMFRAEVINQLHGKRCWQCGKYLGSMLYFDFGERVLIPSIRQSQVEQGEAALGVRDCYWGLSSGGLAVADSESINDGNAAALLSCFKGVELEDMVDPGTGSLNLMFSNDLILYLDTTNRYATEDCIAEFFSPSGRIYYVTPRGHAYLSDQISNVRHQTSRSGLGNGVS